MKVTSDLRFGNKTFKTEKELNKHLKTLNKGKKTTPMFDPYSKAGKKKNKGAIGDWFRNLSQKAQAAYLKAHPNSKFFKKGSAPKAKAGFSYAVVRSKKRK